MCPAEGAGEFPAPFLGFGGRVRLVAMCCKWLPLALSSSLQMLAQSKGQARVCSVTVRVLSTTGHGHSGAGCPCPQLLNQVLRYPRLPGDSLPSLPLSSCPITQRAATRQKRTRPRASSNSLGQLWGEREQRDHGSQARCPNNRAGTVTSHTEAWPGLAYPRVGSSLTTGVFLNRCH